MRCHRLHTWHLYVAPYRPPRAAAAGARRARAEARWQQRGSPCRLLLLHCSGARLCMQWRNGNGIRMGAGGGVRVLRKHTHARARAHARVLSSGKRGGRRALSRWATLTASHQAMLQHFVSRASSSRELA